jgi:RimJ/RimL family protein N-acetyltransferase
MSDKGDGSAMSDKGQKKGLYKRKDYDGLQWWHRFRYSHSSRLQSVYELTTGRPISKTSLTTDDVARSAEFVINIAPESQGKKFGTEATKAYEKAGFKPAGRLRRSEMVRVAG